MLWVGLCGLRVGGAGRRRRGERRYHCGSGRQRWETGCCLEEGLVVMVPGEGQDGGEICDVLDMQVTADDALTWHLARQRGPTDGTYAV